jgi:hypothetical protein
MICERARVLMGATWFLLSEQKAASLPTLSKPKNLGSFKEKESTEALIFKLAWAGVGSKIVHRVRYLYFKVLYCTTDYKYPPDSRNIYLPLTGALELTLEVNAGVLFKIDMAHYV